MRFLKRFRERRRNRADIKLSNDYKYLVDRDNINRVKVRRTGFFSPDRWAARVANRRKFRVEVSGNRKWILIGVAVVAVCGTLVY